MKFQIFALLYSIGYIIVLNTTPYINISLVLWGGLFLYGVIIMLILQYEKKEFEKNSIMFIISLLIIIITAITTIYGIHQRNNEIQGYMEQTQQFQNQVKQIQKQFYTNY